MEGDKECASCALSTRAAFIGTFNSVHTQRITMRSILVTTACSGLLLSACGSSLSRGSESVRSDARAESLFEESRTTEDRAETRLLLEQAITLNPELTVAHIELGSLYAAEGELDDAERSFGTAAQLEPTNFEAQFGHADVLRRLNRLVEAARAYLRALSINRNAPEAHKGLAATYLELGEYSQAMQFAREAVELNPADGESRANLGAAHSFMREHNEAVLQYEAAAELMELTPELLLNWGSSLGALERYREMVTVLERATELETADAESTATVRERLGFAHFKLGSFGEARAAFQVAIDADPRHYPALNGLAVVLLNDYLEAGEQDTALRLQAAGLLRRSLRIEPNQPRFVELLRRFG